MTPEHFDAILKNAQAKGDKDGFMIMPDGGSLTLYVSHDGASLSVSRIEAVKQDGELVYARTQKRETFAFVRSDIFAVAAEGGGGQPARRAGFG
jgi:S-adenosylmethionine hydrolase